MVGVVKGDREWVIKHGRGFCEGDAVLLQVIFRFPIILLKFHAASIARVLRY
jgi:hypothetical protein